MADTTLTAPASETRALSTSYLGSGSRYYIRNARRITVCLPAGSSGFTVQLTADRGSSEDAIEEHVNSGGTWFEEVHRGQRWYLDVKADSGTPSASIKVS